MPTVSIHPPVDSRSTGPSNLPELIQTPLGLAILELQGTINFPQPEISDGEGNVTVGRLVFPDYDPTTGAAQDGWQKRIWFYIGHQRLMGEVKKLPKPLGVLRRAPADTLAKEQREQSNDHSLDDLEVAEIIKWKLVFSSRPEPVGLNEE